MIQHNQISCRTPVLFLVVVMAGIAAFAQVGPNSASPGITSPVPVAASPTAAYVFSSSFKTASLDNAAFLQQQGVAAATLLKVGADGVLTLTLDDAQQAASAAGNPLAQLGALQVEAAKQHRLGVQSQYFPALSTSFVDLHFNKHPGDVVTVKGPLGNTHQVVTNIVNKDQNALNLMGAQPITPLFAIYQLVKIARADENIARAKAGMPVAETARNIEKNYFDLLVAQRELTSAQADAKKIQAKWLTASSAGVTRISTEQETDMIAAEKALVGPASKVKELTAALDAMLGLPDGTRLELVAPDPLVENISLTEVTDKAMMANAEVVEAEQTAVKAHAAATISKMDYVPTVAVIGGYTFQKSINVVFPKAAGYVGAMASLNIYDFGKREHSVKESKTNAQAADLGVQLVKAKVAAAVKTSYFELERSRQFTQLARRMASSAQVIEANYKPGDPDLDSARAKMEAEMFRTELAYRQAFANIKALMGDK